MSKRTLTTLITGASSGIGAEFARQLSKKGYNPILVARRKEKLENLASELEKNYSVDTEILVSDLSKKEGIEKVENYINELDSLDMLINNAGFGIPKRFHDVELKKILDMINLHIIASTRLCYAAIPKIIERGGVVINVSSIASFIPASREAIYSATKSYLTMFSKALQKDLDGKIKVQALCPGFTYTDFFDTKEYNHQRPKLPKSLWMCTEKVVEKSIKALNKNKVVYVPGFNNKLLLKLMDNKFIGPHLWRYYEKTNNEFKRED